MKKYNLVIKENVKFIERGEFPTLTVGNKGYGSYKMLSKSTCNIDSKPFTFMLNLEKNKGDKKTTFTQQEIDELPYGFVKLFDIIEAKEELYYIEMPHSGGVVLNEVSQVSEVRFADPVETTNYKTKFTLEYIEEIYPEYKQFAVKVEEEE